MTRKNTLSALALMLAAVMLSMAPAIAANPAFNKAVADYKAGKYAQAASAFESLKTSYPSGGLSRYYLALSRQGLGQYAKAKAEYEWVATNGDAELKGMAQQGAPERFIRGRVAGSRQN